MTVGLIQAYFGYRVPPPYQPNSAAMHFSAAGFFLGNARLCQFSLPRQNAFAHITTALASLRDLGDIALITQTTEGS